MTEDNPKNEESDLELVPLTSDQHEITSVPKNTTDFPFFYLTKHKDRLSEPVIYEGLDSEGRPMRWVATPNATIGPPGIDAHEAWTRLVKPTWEAYRTSDNQLPNIVPLGGVRQCLRVVGWGIGGWEARRLLKALNQIGATWCNADFWIPTSKKNENGSPTFRQIKGQFSRLTIYAIGDKHLTEEELQSGNFSFDFDLADTLYIQFHPLEVAIQESQPHKYLDNQYMFSVGAAARRWYELMNTKIFGVVKNNGRYCEVLYSWYVKHHHTLHRQTERRRVVQQINAILRAHLDSKFIDRVEYRPIREIGKQIDFVIRFYPGLAAKHSIARVLSSINKKRLPPAGQSAVFSRVKKPYEIQKPRKEYLERLGSVEVRENEMQVPLNVKTQENILTVSESRFVDELAARGILRSHASKLLSTLSEEQHERVGDYIDYWDSQPNVGLGLLYDLIRNGDRLPANFETRKQKTERLAIERERRRLAEIEKVLEARYGDHCRQLVDQFIQDTLLPGEFESRVDAYRAEIAKRPGVWNSSQIAGQFAPQAVRMEIAKETSLPTYEDFRRQALAEGLTELRIDPTRGGGEYDKSDAVVGDSMRQDAINGSPADVPPPADQSVDFEENSSPRAF